MSKLTLIAAAFILLAAPAFAQETPAEPAGMVAAKEKATAPQPKPLTGSEPATVTMPLGAWNAILTMALPEMQKKVGDPIEAQLNQQLAPQIHSLQYPDAK